MKTRNIPDDFPSVILGQYLGLEIPAFQAVVSEEELNEHIEADRMSLAVEYTVEFHPEEEGGCIRQLEVPEADDEFARMVSDFDTLSEYKAHLRELLLMEQEELAAHNKEAAVLAAAAANAEIHIPQAMINDELTRLMEDLEDQLDEAGFDFDEYLEETGITEEELVEDYANKAKSQVTRQLLLEAIAEQEGIEITEEDLEAEMEEFSESYELSLEEVKDYYTGENLELLRKELMARAALELIVDSAIEK